MALKSENEKAKSHRVFKYYKATNSFPPDVSSLEAYHLLAKYNYFIAKDLDKKTLNTLTEICGILDREKILLIFGDFLLETLYFGLNSFRHHEKEVKLIYIDALNESVIDFISNASITSNHFKKYIIYIVDNCENMKSKEIEVLRNFKKELENVDKAVICCTLSLNLVNKAFKIGFKRLKLGNDVSNELSLRNYVYLLFNNNDKEYVYEILKNAKFSVGFFISVISFNIFHFFEKDIEKLYFNIAIVEKCNSLLYKTSDKLLLRFLVYSFKTTKIKRVIRFPEKLTNEKPALIKKSKNVRNNVKRYSKKHSRKKGRKQTKKNSKRKKGGLLKF